MKLQTTFSVARLLSLSVLLAFASVSRASNELSQDRKRDVRWCEKQCQRQQPYFEEHLCRERCNYLESDGPLNLKDDAEEEYERCQDSCRGSGKKQWLCQSKCKDEYEAAATRERRRKEREELEDERRRREEREEQEDERRRRDPDERKHHGDDDDKRSDRHSQEQDYSHCLKRCQDDEEGFPRQRQCKLRCEEKFDKHRERHRHREGKLSRQKDLNSLNKKCKKEKDSDNPYYFDSQSFESRYSTGEGHMKVLQRFLEKSDLLLGIDRFRVGFYEANPNTFMLPHHWDADSVLFVIKGNATMTFLKKKNRETFNLERGDVMVIPSGTTAYLISTQEDEKLQIAELLRPVNTPGRYQQFFGVGGEESKSFLNSFSTEILQAALNIPRDQLEKLLKQQNDGPIVKASRDQVQAFAHGISRKQFGASRIPFSLLDERPQSSNEHGKFYEVTPDDYQKLEDLDVSVAYCHIQQGSMMAPHYNSRTTYIVMVEEGSGYFEITRPHLDNESNKKKQGTSQSYKKVRTCLSKGDVFVIPVGHPIALVASENESIKFIGFGINAEYNQRNFFAGEDNIINLLNREAMQLSFNLPAKEVEEMFQKQRQTHFMAGPKRKHDPLISILDFAGF